MIKQYKKWLELTVEQQQQVVDLTPHFGYTHNEFLYLEYGINEDGRITHIRKSK